MTFIKHFIKKEKVYQEFNDRGTTWWGFALKDIEHYRCSNCNSEVNPKSKFCLECGKKFTKIKEVSEWQEILP